MSTFAEGLPPQVLGVGGAMDVAFVDSTAYVLVSVVGGDIVDGDPIGDATVGIYRLDDDGSFTVFADIGAWSIEHPPETDYFITTGVQYALERYGDGFLVTDGHHNRVLRVDLDGGIDELIAFDNIVPTGLDTFGVVVAMAQAGPIPHLPRGRQGRGLRAVADDGRRRRRRRQPDRRRRVRRGLDLYALSQGQWDEVGEGSPASPDTGRLVKADWAGASRARRRRRRRRDRARPTDLAGARRGHGLRGRPRRHDRQDREPLTSAFLAAPTRHPAAALAPSERPLRFPALARCRSIDRSWKWLTAASTRSSDGCASVAAG